MRVVCVFLWLCMFFCVMWKLPVTLSYFLHHLCSDKYGNNRLKKQTTQCQVCMCVCACVTRYKRWASNCSLKALAAHCAYCVGVSEQALLPLPLPWDHVKLSPYKRCDFRRLAPPWLSKQQEAGNSGRSATAASYFCSSAQHSHISCLNDIFAGWCGTTSTKEPFELNILLMWK